MRSPLLLCVDHSSQFLEVRKTRLEKLGLSVVTATSVPGALAILEKMPIDAVVMDYGGEGIDSQAVAFHIRRRFPRQPIILLSAYSEIPQRILSLVDDCIMKTESPERIAQVVQKLAGSDTQLKSTEKVKSYRATA